MSSHNIEKVSEGAHESEAHDRWFREQVDIAITEAGDPSAEWVSNEQANDSWAKKRAQLIKRSETSGD
jgi:hypothetical protein